MMLAIIVMFLFFTFTDQFTTFGIKMANIFIFTMIFNFKTSSYTKKCSFFKSLTSCFFLNNWTWWKGSMWFSICQSLHMIIFKIKSYTEIGLLNFQTFFFYLLDAMTIMLKFFKNLICLIWSVFKFTGHNLTNNCFFFGFFCSKVSSSNHQCISSFTSSFFSIFDKFLSFLINVIIFL